MSSPVPKLKNDGARRDNPLISSMSAFVGNAATMLFHPFEALKVRFQVENGAANNPVPKYNSVVSAFSKIYKDEGLGALYRGSLITFAATSVANIVFFYVYSQGKKAYNYDAATSPYWHSWIISARSSLTSTTITMPLWTLKTRVILHLGRESLSQTRGIYYRIVKDIIKNEGFFALYSGYIPSLLLCIYGIIQMFVYEQLNYLTGNNRDGKSNLLLAFLIGGTSKCVASATLHPVNLVRSRLQQKQFFNSTSTHPEGKEIVLYKGFFDCIKKTYQKEGLLAFYKGVAPNVIRIFPSSGAFFLGYEGTLKLFNKFTRE